MTRRILVAEDSPTQAERVRFLLESEGYAVDIARNGREGLDRLRLAPPHLIVSDVVMPEMDGYAFCRAVKASRLTRDIPFVLLTDRRSPLDIIKGLELGADNFITKPFEDEVLLERIRRIFEHAEARQRGELQIEVSFRVGEREIRVSADKQQIFELLFSTFEEMCTLHGQLEQSRREVEAYARNLEVMVEERTRELRSLFDRVPIGLLRMTIEGRIDAVNPALVELLGASRPEDLVGRDIIDFYLAPADRQRLLERFRSAEVVTNHETVLKRLDGTPVPVQVDIRRVVDRPSGGVYLDSALQDLTERRRIEDEMRRQQEALAQSEKVATMGALLAGVAHELNNPLAVMMGQTHLLRETAGDAGTATRAEKIHAAAERCSRIVKNFLALARQRPPERSHVNIASVVREAAELLGYELRTGGVEVTLDLDESVPRLWADGHQLHQVFVNLLVNAQHAMRRQATPRGITVRTRAAAGGVEIEVADTGPGIPAELRDKIFQPFFTTKPAGEGTGLGLSLCRNVIEEHKGTLAVESEPGQGARFTITLPAPLEAPAATERAAPSVAAAPVVGRRTILVVDDEPDIAGVLAEAFSRDGHEVDVAGDGATALERLGRRAYDLVVTDSKMPGMDGADFYREMIHRNREIRGRIVFVTGDVLDREKLAFLESTGAPFLPKPFDVAEVRRVAYRILASGGAR